MSQIIAIAVLLGGLFLAVNPRRQPERINRRGR